MPLRRLLELVLLKCRRVTTAAGGRKFLVVGAAARDAPARIAARRTARAWVLHVSQAMLIVRVCSVGKFGVKGLGKAG